MEVDQAEQHSTSINILLSELHAVRLSRKKLSNDARNDCIRINTDFNEAKDEFINDFNHISLSNPNMFNSLQDKHRIAYEERLTIELRTIENQQQRQQAVHINNYNNDDDDGNYGFQDNIIRPFKRSKTYTHIERTFTPTSTNGRDNSILDNNSYYFHGRSSNMKRALTDTSSRHASNIYSYDRNDNKRTKTSSHAIFTDDISNYLHYKVAGNNSQNHDEITVTHQSSSS